MQQLIKLILLLFTTSVFAEDVLLEWELPTENVDGTPLTDLAGIRVYELIADIPDPTATTYIDEDKFEGTYSYLATAYNSQNEESTRSNIAVKTSTSFVTVEPTVYAIQQFRNKFLLLPVGTVALGLTCVKEESMGLVQM